MKFINVIEFFGEIWRFGVLVAKKNATNAQKHQIAPRGFYNLFDLGKLLNRTPVKILKFETYEKVNFSSGFNFNNFTHQFMQEK
jgi:hypothetical protein